MGLMGRLWKALNHAGMALFVFVALSGAFLWRTGSLRFRLTGAELARAPATAVPPRADTEKADEAPGADWCAEHGAPESACTRCNPALVAAFKAKGDWCSEHNLPESQCTVCKPSPKPAGPAKAEESDGVAMCTEHGVPESACTRCNPALIPAFKAKGDWCSGHNLPESQCTACNPDLKKPPENPPAPSVPPDPTLSALEKRNCEHGKRQVDCDSCRFELGVVKLRPSVAKALLTLAKVERREVAAEIRLTGEVQLDQTRLVDVSPPAAGRITKVLARLGQTVKQGDTLAVIHSGDFGEAKAKFLEAATQLEITRKEQERQAAVSAALEKLLDRLAKGDGAPTEAGTARDGSGKPKELIGEGRSKLVGAAAKLKLARSVYQREKELHEKQVSSKADFEAARQELESAQADYTALVEEAYLNLSLDRLRAENAARKAEADLNVARERLHLFGLDHAATDALRQAKDNGGFASLDIKAPHAGTITAHNAVAGKSVEPTQSLYTIADLSNLWVWCDLYERDLAFVHDRLAAGKPLEAAVRVSAFRDAPFPGTLDLLGSTVDEHTRTVKARVQVPNPQGKLRPGMFASVEVKVPSDGPAAFVPRDAVLADAGKSFVFQHWKDDLWVRRDVRLGRSHGRFIEIASGVPDGITLAVGGAFMLKGDILRGKMGAG